MVTAIVMCNNVSTQCRKSLQQWRGVRDLRFNIRGNYRDLCPAVRCNSQNQTWKFYNGRVLWRKKNYAVPQFDNEPAIQGARIARPTPLSKSCNWIQERNLRKDDRTPSGERQILHEVLQAPKDSDTVTCTISSCMEMDKPGQECASNHLQHIRRRVDLWALRRPFTEF